MKLQEHIDNEHDGNQAEFARALSKTLGRDIFPQQVTRWLANGADWIDGRLKLDSSIYRKG